MKRKIIKIDEEKCNGCGLCADACHEGAIGMVDGKAKLLRDDYCDGLGNCLPVCPTGAITFEEREAAAFDEAAVKRNMLQKAEGADEAMGHSHGHAPGGTHSHGQGCPGAKAHAINREAGFATPAGQEKEAAAAPTAAFAAAQAAPGELRQWPVQIKLVPVNAPYFENADLLIAADCAAYAYGNFHAEFIRGKITLIGCPKLDEVDYTEKLTEIIALNNIKSVTVVRMEVPCCGGIEQAVINALKNSGKMIPWQRVTLSTDGRIL